MAQQQQQSNLGRKGWGKHYEKKKFHGLPKQWALNTSRTMAVLHSLKHMKLNAAHQPYKRFGETDALKLLEQRNNMLGVGGHSSRLL